MLVIVSILSIATFFLEFKAVASTSHAVCDPQPVYADSISRFIPYTNAAINPGLMYDVAFDFSISTSHSPRVYNFTASMDTGSTGVTIGAAQLGLSLKDLETYQPGSEFLSSSHVFWEGYWINASAVNLTFTAANLTAKVPILAVTKSSICGNFKNGTCEESSKTNITLWPTHIRYLGVGFGRWSPEQPGGTPDKVPLTNIAFVDGAPVPKRAIHVGYVINFTGVEVGLTRMNTRNFACTKLGLTSGSPAPRDWAQVNMSLAVDDSHWNNGSALFDTGIDQSYIRVDEETTSQLHETVIYDRGKNRSVLTPESTVHMRIGTDPDFVAYYNVKVGDIHDIVRPYRGEFRTEAASILAFLNTGRYFYKGFDALFDAECGWFGVRWRGGPGDEDGGQYSRLIRGAIVDQQPKSIFSFAQ